MLFNAGALRKLTRRDFTKKRQAVVQVVPERQHQTAIENILNSHRLRPPDKKKSQKPHVSDLFNIVQFSIKFQ
ncbi:hypothetical protein VIBHAR_06710 [Vibrio campbellii ATCC BAA-1116]|uniref:Uncharacterized protein n=1 Tax=Vibrio campbellii (strain ATCC BAA-1116) TaxID=2902295 RepID=A7N6X2_VIBC1|nr:hypothetical protein VIBHAR_06710 [Vibrio campbellii ATCC BAA-1116]